MRKVNDLGKDSIFSLVLKLAIPTMVAQFVNVLYSIIDRMYIGNIPQIGPQALAGVGICGPIVTLLSSFGTLVGIGGSVFMAMKLGEKDHDTAKKILSNSFLLLILFSAGLTVLFLCIKSPLLVWFGASETTFEYANSYMTIYTIGTFFALLAIGLNSFITCQGFANISMMTVLIGAVGNIILDFVFIPVLGWGVQGAAWATVISQMLSCLFAVGFLIFSKKITVHISFGGYQADIIKRIFSLGFSPFVILATDSILIIAMNAMLQKYGGAQGDMLITCATIMQSFLMLITGPMIGITGGTQAIISYNFGARQGDRVRQTEKYVLLLCLIFTTIMFLLSRTIPQIFVKIFTQDPVYLRLSVQGIQIFTLGIIPLSLQYTFVDGFTALGCSKIALFLSLTRKGIYLASIFLLPIFFSAQAVFYAEPICDFIASGISTVFFLYGFDKYIQLREAAYETN